MPSGGGGTASSRSVGSISSAAVSGAGAPVVLQISWKETPSSRDLPADRDGSVGQHDGDAVGGVAGDDPAGHGGHLRIRSAGRRSSRRARWRRPRSRSTQRSWESWSCCVERVAAGVQHRGHPPREVGAAPDPAQRGVGVVVGEARVVLAQQVDEGGREQADVGDREVEPLGAGRRHDVRGVAGQEQPAVPHRRLHERAHRQHALLGDRARGERPAVLAVAEPGGERRPRSGRRTSSSTSVPLGTWR